MPSNSPDARRRSRSRCLTSSPIKWNQSIKLLILNVIQIIPAHFAVPIFIIEGIMQDFSKLAAQVRGARALLGWSQAYLAEGINVRRVVIADLESCKHEPQASTLFALMSELTAAGIVFTETGVEFQHWPPSPYVPTGCAGTRKRIRRKHYSMRDVTRHSQFTTSV